MQCLSEVGRSGPCCRDVKDCMDCASVVAHLVELIDCEQGKDVFDGVEAGTVF